MNARLRARLVLLAIAAVLLPALPAGAARVVQVRIGEHPGFTRVVFELDAPAGYRVERKAGSYELVVTLDAASQARKLARKSSDIRAVDVEGGEHAVARVRLSNPKLQLKEMILSNPPRIVLDVLREKPVVAAVKPKPAPKPAAETTKAAEAKPAPAPKPSAEARPAAPPKPIAETAKPSPVPKPAAEAVPAPAPKPIAKAEPAPAPKPAPEAAKPPAPAPKPLAEAKPPAPVPPPATSVKPPAPTPAPVAETAKPPAPAPRPVAEVKLAESPKPVVELKPPAPKAEVPAPAIPIAEALKPAAPPVPTPPSAKPLMTAEDLAKLVAAKSAEEPGEEPAAKLTPPSPATPDAATPTPAKPSPPPGAVVEVAKPAPAPAKSAPAPAKLAPATKPAAAAKAAAGSSWLSNPIVLGVAGGVLLCVIGLVFLLRRRRALPNDLDVTAIAEHAGLDDAGAARAEAHLGSTDDDPFSLFDGDDSAAAAQSPVAAPARRPAAPAPAPDADADSEASFASLFDDDELHGPTVSQGAATMNQPPTSDFPMDRPGTDRTAATPRQASAVPGADVVRLVQDLERRMSLLEKKLGDANEAREKLERQVAAQSEELRVQRAAIARTQRALRTMTRGEEDKATEPALREDPSGQTQSKTRINL